MDVLPHETVLELQGPKADLVLPRLRRPRHVPAGDMLLRCKRKYFAQLKDIVQVILGHDHPQFIDFQFYCDKAPYLMVLKHLREKLLDCIRWKDTVGLRLLLKANEIRIRRSSFAVDPSIRKLVASIFTNAEMGRGTRLRQLLKEDGTRSTNFIFSLLVQVSRMPFPISAADRRIHRLQTPEREYESYVHMEGTVTRLFYQTVFAHLRRKGVHVYKRTLETSSDPINRRFLQAGGALREFVLAYLPLKVRDTGRFVHKDIPALDLVDAVRPAVFYFVLLTRHQRSAFAFQTLMRRLFFRLLPFLEALYLGHRVPCSTRQLLAMVREVGRGQVSFKAELPQPRHVNHDPEGILYETPRTRHLKKMGTFFHRRFLQPYPGLNAEHPVFSLKVNQTAHSILAAEVPLTDGITSGRADLMLLAQADRKPRPVFIIDLKTHFAEEEELHSPNAWREVVRRSPTAAEAHQLREYRRMAAGQFNVAADSIRLAILAVDGRRTDLQEIRSQLRLLLHHLMFTDIHCRKPAYFELGTNAHLVLPPGTHAAFGQTEPITRRQVDAKLESAPFDRTVDIHVLSPSLRPRAVATAESCRLAVLDYILRNHDCFTVTPSLAVRRLMGNPPGTFSESFEGIREWLRRKPSKATAKTPFSTKRRCIVLHEYDLYAEEAREALEGLPLTDVQIIRFRTAKRGQTVSSVYRTKTFRADAAAVRIYIAPPRPSTRGGRTELGPLRYMLIDNGKIATKVLRVDEIRGNAPQSRPEDILDLIDELSTFHDPEPAVPSFRKLDWKHSPWRGTPRRRKRTARIRGSLEVKPIKGTTVPHVHRKIVPGRHQALQREHRRRLYMQRCFGHVGTSEMFERNMAALETKLFGEALGIGRSYLPFLQTFGTPKAFTPKVLALFATDMLVQAGADLPYIRDFRQIRRCIRHLLERQQVTLQAFWIAIGFLRREEGLYLYIDWPTPRVLRCSNPQDDCTGSFYWTRQQAITLFEEIHAAPAVSLRERSLLFAFQGTVFAIRVRGNGYHLVRTERDPDSLVPPKGHFNPYEAFNAYSDHLEQNLFEVVPEVQFENGLFRISFLLNDEPVWRTEPLQARETVQLLWKGDMPLRKIHLLWRAADAVLQKQAEIIRPWLAAYGTPLTSLKYIPETVELVSALVTATGSTFTVQWCWRDKTGTKILQTAEELAAFLGYPYGLGTAYVYFHPVEFFPEPDLQQGRIWLKQGTVELLRPWLPENVRSHPALPEHPRYEVMCHYPEDPMAVTITYFQKNARGYLIPSTKSSTLIQDANPDRMIRKLREVLRQYPHAENLEELTQGIEETIQRIEEGKEKIRLKGDELCLEKTGTFDQFGNPLFQLTFSYQRMGEIVDEMLWHGKNASEACRFFLKTLEQGPDYVVTLRQHAETEESTPFNIEISIAESGAELITLFGEATGSLQEIEKKEIFKDLLQTILLRTVEIFSAPELRKKKAPLGDLTLITETTLQILEDQFGQQWWHTFRDDVWKNKINVDFDVVYLLDLNGVLTRSKNIEKAKSLHLKAYHIRKKLGNYGFLWISYSELANVMATKKKWNKAIKYQKLVNRVSPNLPVAKILAHLNMATYAYNLQNIREINFHFQIAHDLIENLSGVQKNRLQKIVHERVNALKTKDVQGLIGLAKCTCTQKTSQQ